MAANFVAASTQYLINSAAPLVATGYPCTFGCWFRRTTTGVIQGLFSFHDTGASNHYLTASIGATDVVTMTARAGSTANSTSTTGTIGANLWGFAIFRFIASGNRRLSVLFPTGVTEHTQTTTSRVPANMDTMTIGLQWIALAAASPMNGHIAEYWYTATDIQPGGGVFDNAMLWQLAKYGPLSVPHIKAALIEYLPLNTSVRGDKGDYYSSRGRQQWANTNGVTLA